VIKEALRDKVVVGYLVIATALLVMGMTGCALTSREAWDEQAHSIRKACKHRGGISDVVVFNEEPEAVVCRDNSVIDLHP
jgi:hypothetical protein